MDLYISSYEYKGLEMANKIISHENALIDKRSALIVEIKQPLIGQKYGLLDKDISKLFLVGRFDDTAFATFDKFPIYVHVFIPKASTNLFPTTFSQMQNIGWACLYDNLSDAQVHKLS